MIQLGVVLLLCWLLSLHYVVVSAHEEDMNGRVRWERTEHLQVVVDRLRLKLEILEPVKVSLVDSNPLVISVETLSTRSGPFVIRADQPFLAMLSDEEVEAALAHELGHVWIYTHQPYVQTERLANEIALRAVNRTALEPLYEKLWKRVGVKGNLADLMGEPVALAKTQH